MQGPHNFVKSAVLKSKDGVLFDEESYAGGSAYNKGKTTVKFDMKDFKFKSIHEQVKEENEIISKEKKLRKDPNFEEKALTSISYNDAFQVDEDFDYFQYYGNKNETEEQWAQQLQEDIEKYKSRANAVYDQTAKPVEIILNFENPEEEVIPPPKTKTNLKLKIKPKTEKKSTEETKPEDQVNRGNEVKEKEKEESAENLKRARDEQHEKDKANEIATKLIPGEVKVEKKIKLPESNNSKNIKQLLKLNYSDDDE